MYTVTITSQGQITIPAKVRRQLKLDKTKKANVSQRDGIIIIEPVKDLLELGGSLKANKRVSERKIREAFGQYLAKEAIKGMPRNTLKKLGFREISSNIFAPSKIYPAHKNTK